MSGYFFYPYEYITNPTVKQLYNQDYLLYKCESLLVTKIHNKTGGYWQSSYFEAGILHESVGGETKFLLESMIIRDDGMNSKQANKFINFVCSGIVYIKRIFRNTYKITKMGHSEFIIYSELDHTLLSEIKYYLPPMTL